MADFSIKLSDYGYNILQIETMGICNMKCAFCAYPLKEDKKSVLSEDLIYRLIDEVDLKDPGFQYICFNQFNEPLMDGRIFKFIRYARKRSVPCLIVTNGILLSKPEIVSELLDAAPDMIKVSLQVIDKCNFKHARGIDMDPEAYFQIIYDFLSKARGTPSRINVDIACNFLNKKGYLLRRALGVSIGDPSVPMSLRMLEKDLISFLAGLAQRDPSFPLDEAETMNFLRNTSDNYISEEGFPLAENIRLKVKPFIYGRRIAEFQPTSHAFACSNRMLGVMADGNVMPCCLGYMPELSLGNVKQKTLREIVLDRQAFLTNLRTDNTVKHDLCKKCYGEPTKRGVWSRAIVNKLRNS